MAMRFVIKCFLVLLLALTAGWVGATTESIETPFSQSPDIEVFVRAGCPHCAKAKEFLARLQQEQPALRMLLPH